MPSIEMREVKISYKLKKYAWAWGRKTLTSQRERDRTNLGIDSSFDIHTCTLLYKLYAVAFVQSA